MDKQIKQRFNESILQETMQRFSIATDAINSLDGSESFIYEFARGSEAFILRIGHSARRNEALIHGEVDWINYLADGGASVARAVRSANDRLVEAMPDGTGDYFLAVAFEKVDGKSAWEGGGWTPELYEQYGQLLGKMHRLAKDYQPANPAWARPQWDDALISDIEENLPPTENVVLKKYRAVFEHISGLPKDKDSFGLIHFDAHGGNFLVDKSGTITLFDFDDCNYNWFINDIAIVLFYMVAVSRDKTKITTEFMPHFLRGYRQENQLDAEWLKEIPYFLKLREIDLYAVIHRSFDVNDIEDSWAARFMENRKTNIEHDVPFVAFDFESLAEWL